MAEIILQRRKAASVLNEPSPLIILLIICLLELCGAQLVNRAPHFVPQTGDMSQFSISEDTVVGTPVYHLKGIDPENRPLTYSISGQYFSVDSTTGVVTLAKSLDREEQAKLEVIISITDESIEDTEPNTISLRRVIPVRDVNDNAPVFHNRPYIVNISEALPVGSEIEVTPNIIVTDIDEGENAKIQITCSTKERGSDAEACATFRIDTEMITPNKYLARIHTSKPLDYETRTAYAITLEARDSGKRSQRAVATLAVAVRDEQDQPPVLMNAPYSAAVGENTEPNTSIMEIIAKDGDTANPRPVLLTLEGDAAQYFKLVPERPIGRATLVTTDIPLDRESDIVVQNGGVYNFFVKATELINNEVPSDYTIMPITIVVTDVDDHAPSFNQPSFSLTVPENIEQGSPLPGLSMYVDDPDLGQNSRYNLSLRDIFNSEGVFTISTNHGEGRTPISIKVNDSSKLDYDVDDEEQRLFVFDVVASVNGEEMSSTRVNVKLLDMNDNAPVFDLPQYKFDVLENSAIGLKIGNITAKDKDYGIFGEIEYSLAGFGSNMFRTDPINGGLFVAGNLDYEVQKSYSLTMLAKDGGGKGTSVSVFVDVMDVNDNAPIFELPEYSRTIRDGATSFEPQLIVRASDADGPTQGGGRVKYSLEWDNLMGHIGEMGDMMGKIGDMGPNGEEGKVGGVFEVDEDSGEVRIMRRVMATDTARGIYELLLRATDYGKPPLYNETKVYIRVGVPGNQRPVFKGNYHQYKQTNPISPNAPINPTSYKASVREDIPSGYNVTTVVANDPDGLDELVRYHIVSGAKDNFVINEKTGLITVSNDANLDLDSNPDHYEIIVSAVDSGTPVPETATTTVFITVQDVNDKPPKFNHTETTTYISEITKKDEIVTKMAAYDTDLNSKLKYSLVSIKAFSKAGVQLKENSNYNYKNIFKINEDSGEITVNGTLDYSQASIVILTVKVTDVNAQINKDKQFDVTEYTVYIQPYADKNPQFTNPGWTPSNPVIHHKVKEEQPIGSTVLVLMAEDPTSGHVVSNFKVLTSETGLLQVDPLSGQVVLTKHLDYEELTNPNLTLTVQATSNDGSKHSIAKVIIEVVNINDNSPIFEKELYKASVLESSQYPEEITRVSAHDSDAVLTPEDESRGFNTVRYTLRGDYSELLHVDPVSGVVTVAQNRSLDRERQSVVSVQIEACDGGGPAGGTGERGAGEETGGRGTGEGGRCGRATLLVDVLDVNDNAPVFDKDVYTAVVPESVGAGSRVLQLLATDPDEGLAADVHYRLLDESDAHGLFTLDPDTGVLSTNRGLTGRGRTDPYRLLAEASDGTHAGLAGLVLYVGDVSSNDGVPTFIRPGVGEVLSVSEDAPIGTPVYQVVASDPDDPSVPAGQLVYSIQRGNDDADVFAIDPQTGILSTRRALDREHRAAYTLVAEAADRGEPPQRASRVLSVLVRDVDDHRPRFGRGLDDPPLLMTTKEEVPVGSVIGTLEAIDEDIGENAEIDYVITAGNELELIKVQRTNDSKAQIIANARIDREAISRLLLTIKCFKYKTVPKLSKSYNRLDPTEIQLLIKIIDIDDHLPQFDSSNMTVGVRLNVPIDTVIATVKATDKDPNSLAIEYKIINMTFESPIKSKSISNLTDVIVLNNTNGELKIMKNLIHYADGTFWLTIRANNSNETDRHSDISVEVPVVRERDLLRLTGVTPRRTPALREALQQLLAPRGLKLQLHDALPLPAHLALYDGGGPCFQIRKTNTGTALTPHTTLATLRALGAPLHALFQQHAVRNVTGCGRVGGAGVAGSHSPAQYALLVLAAGLCVAAGVAARVLCCLHSDAKRRMKSALLVRESPPAIPTLPTIAPTRLYAEPLYST